MCRHRRREEGGRGLVAGARGEGEACRCGHPGVRGEAEGLRGQERGHRRETMPACAWRRSGDAHAGAGR